MLKSYSEHLFEIRGPAGGPMKGREIQNDLSGSLKKQQFLLVSKPFVDNGVALYGAHFLCHFVSYPQT